MAESHAEIAQLLSALDQAFDRKSWHGPNLRGSVRGLSTEEVTWRPRPDRHCIAEIVVHAAYWKYAVRRRLLNLERGSFALKGSNWFLLPDPLPEPTWREYLALLESEHEALRAAVAGLTPEELPLAPPGSKVTNLALVQGITAHDVYHAGQVQLLKRLRPEG
jgi:DinB superfamily